MEARQTRRRDGNSVEGSTALALSAGVSELSQLALWMAATLAGMVTAALTARTPFFRGILRRISGSAASAGPARRALGRPGREQSLPMLAEAIVGSSKSAIASVLGPPRSAVLMHAAASALGATYWQADTWYYPLPRSGPLAMVIQFTGDDAQNVEFLRAPEA